MNDKKTYEELMSDINAAARLVRVGMYYAHYKHPEIPYVVKGLAIIEENSEVAVRYASTTNSDVEFVRPLHKWLETVEWQGETLPRFTLLAGPARPV